MNIIRYFFLFTIFFTNSVSTQIKFPVYPDSLFSSYYLQKASFVKSLPDTKNDIVFTGNSITDGAVWSELFNDTHVKSRGKYGATKQQLVISGLDLMIFRANLLQIPPNLAPGTICKVKSG